MAAKFDVEYLCPDQDVSNAILGGGEIFLLSETHIQMQNTYTNALKH